MHQKSATMHQHGHLFEWNCGTTLALQPYTWKWKTNRFFGGKQVILAGLCSTEHAHTHNPGGSEAEELLKTLELASPCPVRLGEDRGPMGGPWALLLRGVTGVLHKSPGQKCSKWYERCEVIDVLPSPSRVPRTLLQKRSHIVNIRSKNVTTHTCVFAVRLQGYIIIDYVCGYCFGLQDVAHFATNAGFLLVTSPDTDTSVVVRLCSLFQYP